MKNKKSLFAIIAVLLVVVVGATFAYFQSSVLFENLFTTGTYKVTTREVFESPDNWAPGEEIPKTITSTNEGTIPAAVRVSYTEQWLDSENVDITSQVDAGTAIINLDNTGDWTKEGNYYYYNYILEPNDTTSSFIKSVTLNPELNDVTCTGEGLTKTCEATNPALGATYKLTITKETVQIDKYKDIWNTQVVLKKNMKSIINALPGTVNDGDGEDGYKYIDSDYVAAHPVYFNPVNPNEECTEANSEQGTTTGCMKWYAYSVKDDIVNMILDHNINPSNEYVYWASEPDFNNYEQIKDSLGVTVALAGLDDPYVMYGNNSRGPLSALTYLKENTSNWNTSVMGNYSFYKYRRYSDIEYNIDYSNYKTRLLTAKEIANIKGVPFNEGTAVWSDSITNLPNWLTINLTDETSIGSRGYWLSTATMGHGTKDAWEISLYGDMGRNYSGTASGIRPVISVPATVAFEN